MKILDSSNYVVFHIDPVEKILEYPSNETVRQDLQKGIAIPPYARADFQNKEVVTPPQPNDASDLYALFEQAVLFRFENEYQKHGFHLA